MPKLLLVLITIASLATAPSAAQEGLPPLDVPYEPTPMPVVHLMLRLAKVGRTDYVIDLGCGDGRIPVTAAKHFGARGYCVDLDPSRVAQARESVARNGVLDRVEVHEGDLFATDLGRASVVTLFLWPSMNLKLRPRLLELRAGTRIVSLDHDMGGWRPDQTVSVPHVTLGRTPLYLWLVPARIAGRWRLSGTTGDRDVELSQSFQFVTSAATDATAEATGQLAGNEVRFLLRSGSEWRAFAGRVESASSMRGDGWTATRPPD